MFQEIELFCLGAATVLDTALLLALLDRDNRRRAVAPLVIIVAGACVFHTGAVAQSLLARVDAGWSVQLHWSATLAMVCGLLLMPSALLHGLVRAATTGFAVDMPADWRYVLLYLPLLAVAPAAGQLAHAPMIPLAEVLAPWLPFYALWLAAANLIGSIGFYRLQRRFELPRTRAFSRSIGQALLMLTVLQSTAFAVLMAWPAAAPGLLLALALSPLPLVGLIAYFILRFNFMRLVLKRTLLYGALVVGVLLFHRVFVDDLWTTLGDRYKVDFALIEVVALILLILAYQPLRQRTAEALRYLLGSRVDELRERSRRLAVQMALHPGDSPRELSNWFIEQGREALGIRYIAVWLFGAGAEISLQAGDTTALTDEQACLLHTSLRDCKVAVCQPADAPTLAVEDGLVQAEAAAAVTLDQPRVAGLVLFGRQHHGETGAEHLNAMVMLAEQLGIVLDNNLLQAERLAAEQRALQNQKLSTLGLIAGSIAHEVKNPLSSIKTITTVMAEELGPDSEYAEDLRLIAGETERLSATVTRLLRFARPAPAGVQSVSVTTVIKDTLGVMRHLARQAQVTLDAEFVPALAPVRGDENALREVFFNLLGNAIEAAGTQGRVCLRCRARGRYIEVTVGDSGPGIPPEIQARLFEPFVTGKHGGTGLGLYLVGRHVRELGGEILCETAPGAGTLFTLKLPVHIDDAEYLNRR